MASDHAAKLQRMTRASTREEVRAQWRGGMGQEHAGGCAADGREAGWGPNGERLCGQVAAKLTRGSTREVG